jgi:DnaJ-like protein
LQDDPRLVLAWFVAEPQAIDEIRRSYSILGVPPTASPEQIRQRYLRLAQEWHPDKWSSDPLAQWRATEKMKRLNEAYARIKDAPLLAERTAGASNVVVFASRPLASNLLIAGWLGIALGLYAFGDSILAVFGVTLIRESGARLDDIRALSRHAPGDTAYGWQSWIVSFGDAAERVLALRALFGLIVASAGLAILRRQSWARTVLATACGVAVVSGVIGLWSLLRGDWVRHTSVPLEAVLLAAVAAYILRLLLTARRHRSFY